MADARFDMSLDKLFDEDFYFACGTLDLTNDTVSTIATGLSHVKFCDVSRSVIATVTEGVLSIIANAADDGTVDIVSTGASGTTVVNWFAIGIKE